LLQFFFNLVIKEDMFNNIKIATRFILYPPLELTRDDFGDLGKRWEVVNQDLMDTALFVIAELLCTVYLGCLVFVIPYDLARLDLPSFKNHVFQFIDCTLCVTLVFPLAYIALQIRTLAGVILHPGLALMPPIKWSQMVAPGAETPLKPLAQLFGPAPGME
jgi:hypothetical protein